MVFKTVKSFSDAVKLKRLAVIRTEQYAPPHIFKNNSFEYFFGLEIMFAFVLKSNRHENNNNNKYSNTKDTHYLAHLPSSSYKPGEHNHSQQFL